MNSVISIARDNQPPLKFKGSLIAESGLSSNNWNYIVYKTADSVKSCDYILYIDYSQTRIQVGGLPKLINFKSLDDLISDLTERLSDEPDIQSRLLEKLGVDNAEYLE